MFGRNKTNEGRPAKVAPPDVGMHHVAGRTSAMGFCGHVGCLQCRFARPGS